MPRSYHPAPLDGGSPADHAVRVAAGTVSSTPHRTDPQRTTIRRAWRLTIGSFAVLGVAALVALAADGPGLLDLVVVVALAVAAVAVVVHRRAMQALEDGRRAEAESYARILQGLSRSVSPDSIVGAIAADLGEVTRADHVVVVRRRAGTGELEAMLVTSRDGIPDSRTLLPISDLDDPGEAQEVADRLARRVRGLFGLRNMVVAPLETPRGVIGALVLSRRTADAWPAAAERLMSAAAREASAALARAYSHREAETQASTDPLTGLPNRRYFEEVCALFARRRRADDAVGVLMIDIDRFKALNDRHGHAVGDEVLRLVARAIVSAVRDDDVPARYGGEEFVVLLRNPAAGVSTDVGQRVRAAVHGLDLSEHGVADVSVSVGVAVATGPDEPIGDLIVAADRALYQAKRAGRDRVVAA